MEISVKRMLRTRGAVVAGVTALAVGLTLVVGDALQRLVSGIPITTGLFDVESLGFAPFADFGSVHLVNTLPFVVGYFLALWLVAPITEELRVGHVVTRAILATGIGVTMLFVVGTVFRVAIALSAPPQSSFLTGAPLTTPETLGLQVANALQSALTALIVLLPLGVLGGVLQWVWRTAHPAEHHIEGLIDV
jgi:hypothetical protein